MIHSIGMLGSTTNYCWSVLLHSSTIWINPSCMWDQFFSRKVLHLSCHSDDLIFSSAREKEIWFLNYYGFDCNVFFSFFFNLTYAWIVISFICLMCMTSRPCVYYSSTPQFFKEHYLECGNNSLFFASWIWFSFLWNKSLDILI